MNKRCAGDQPVIVASCVFEIYHGFMYAGYLDESFDEGNSGLFAVAGLIGDGWRWLDAETRWEAVLNKHGYEFFKSSRLRKRKPEVYAEFAQVLIDARLVGWGTVVRQEEFFEAISGSETHRLFRRSPYFLSYQQAFVDIGWGLRKHHASDMIAIVLDKTDVYALQAQNAFERWKVLNPLSASYLGSLSMEDDEKCRPLQMADLVATELRMEGRFAAGLEADRSPVFQKLRDSVMWRASQFTAPALKEIFSNR